MKKARHGSSRLARRDFLKLAGGAGMAAAVGTRYPHLGVAWGASAVAGATDEERAINGAKALKKKVDLNVLIWGQYYKGQCEKLSVEFKEQTGIGVGNIVDVNIFQMPQRAMAEAVARSKAFDIIHVDATMIPTLANAGYLQPLDKFMRRGGYKLVSNGPQAEICRYGGETYGILTDGNVHNAFVRKDLVEEHGKRFEDTFGKKLEWPETWDDYLQLGKFFYEATDGKVFGFADLRSRKAGAPAWFMMPFYAAGGFPFADDMTPTLNNAAGQKAMEMWLGTKPYQHKEASVWGTTQTIPFFMAGNISVFSYWDGSIQVVESEKSATRGKWLFGVMPGSRTSGRLIKRAISYPLPSLLINRRSQNPEAAYWLCQFLGGAENSTRIVADKENVFHDPWHPKHMTDERVIKAYTPEGMKAVEKCLQVTTPAILMPGYQEFWDLLDKNLADAFVGTITGDQALKKTEEEWKDAIKRVGAKRLARDLATYKGAFPKVDVPA